MNKWCPVNKLAKMAAALSVAILLFFLLRGVKKAAPPPATRPPIPSDKAEAEARIPRGEALDVFLKAHRIALGQCLVQAVKTRVSTVTLVTHWDIAGNLAKVSVTPELGEAPADCLFSLVRGCKLPPATDAKPLVVVKQLQLSLSAPSAAR